MVLVLIGVSVVFSMRKRERERNLARLEKLRAKYAAAQPKSNPAFAGLTKTSQVVPLAATGTELKAEAVE